MKKNYIYLTLLIIVTVILTLVLAGIYKVEIEPTSFSYNKMNKIKSEEYDGYIMENQDMIIYISDKTDLSNSKKEKSFVKKLERLNLLELTIYIDKEEMNKKLSKKLERDYSYKFNKNKLPAILVINDGEISEIAYINSETDVSSIINYEVFK